MCLSTIGQSDIKVLLLSLNQYYAADLLCETVNKIKNPVMLELFEELCSAHKDIIYIYIFC